jgi:hypothetical protein
VLPVIGAWAVATRLHSARGIVIASAAGRVRSASRAGALRPSGSRIVAKTV